MIPAPSLPQRPRAPTILSWPPPPGPGTVRPPPPSITRVHDSYSTRPPAIRERLPTLELVEDDIIEAVPAPVASLSTSLPVTLAGTAWQAARACATALRQALEARAVAIHALSPWTDEFRIIGAQGPATDHLLGSVVATDEDIVTSALCANGKPWTLGLGDCPSRIRPDRVDVVGATRSLVAVPILVDGRCIGIIEVFDVNPKWARDAIDACTFAGERLAEQLAALE